DPHDRALQRVPPVVRATFDGRVAVGGHLHGINERGGGPATGLPLGTFNFPGRHAQLAGELVRAPPAGGGHPGDGADPVGQRVGDRDRVDADVQGPPQRLQRAGYVADHGRVGDREPADLGASPVVPGDRLGADAPVRVGDELRTRGDEFAQVVADRCDERLGRVLAALAAEPADLVADEVDAFPVPADLDGRDDGGARVAQPVGERLALAAAGVRDDQGYLGIGLAGVPDERGHQILLGVLSLPYDERAASSEQRRAQHLRQLPWDEVTGAVLAHLDVRVGGPGGRDGVADGARDEQFLVAEDKLNTGGLRRHPDIVARSPHPARRLAHEGGYRPWSWPRATTASPPPRATAATSPDWSVRTTRAPPRTSRASIAGFG